MAMKTGRIECTAPGRAQLRVKVGLRRVGPRSEGRATVLGKRVALLVYTRADTPAQTLGGPLRAVCQVRGSLSTGGRVWQAVRLAMPHPAVSTSCANNEATTHGRISGLHERSGVPRSGQNCSLDGVSTLGYSRVTT
jgi:hypothetical protein